MVNTPSPYLSYLLRLWLAGDDDQPDWRLALVDPQTGEARGFASLEELTAFLQARMEVPTSTDSEGRATPPDAREAPPG